MVRWIKRFEENTKFTAQEAWNIYRLAAFAEAFGWTCLIIAVVIAKFSPLGSLYAIPIAGQIHGTFFVTYFILLIALYPSMAWKRTHFLIAVLAGVTPYGSLIFEIYASRHLPVLVTKKKLSLLIILNTNMLVMEPSRGIGLQLPTFKIASGNELSSLNQITKNLYGSCLSCRLVHQTKSANQQTDYYQVVNKSLRVDKLQRFVRYPEIEELLIVPIHKVLKELKLDPEIRSLLNNL